MVEDMLVEEQDNVLADSVTADDELFWDDMITESFVEARPTESTGARDDVLADNKHQQAIKKATPTTTHIFIMSKIDGHGMTKAFSAGNPTHGVFVAPLNHELAHRINATPQNTEVQVGVVACAGIDFIVSFAQITNALADDEPHPIDGIPSTAITGHTRKATDQIQHADCKKPRKKMPSTSRGSGVLDIPDAVVADILRCGPRNTAKNIA